MKKIIFMVMLTLGVGLTSCSETETSEKCCLESDSTTTIVDTLVVESDSVSTDSTSTDSVSTDSI